LKEAAKEVKTAVDNALGMKINEWSKIYNIAI
jgi:hypothetical protein